MERFVFIGCGKRKKPPRGKPYRAVDLYEGGYFRLCLQLARQYTDDRHIRILSAKHHVLSLEDLVEPYELTLNKFSSKELAAWKAEVAKHLTTLRGELLFICGDRYHRGLPGRAIIPQGLTIGFQQRWIKQQLQGKGFGIGNHAEA